MTTFRRRLTVTVISVAIVVIITPFLVIGGDPGEKTPEELAQEHMERDLGYPVEKPSGVFYCSIKSRDDVFQANMFRMEVKVYPASGNWVGKAFDPEENIANEIVETVWIKIRGVDSPGMHEFRQPNWTEHHTRIARHRQRHTEGSKFAWDMLNTIEIKWLTNPERTEGELYVTCDLFLEIAGNTVSFAAILDDEGHGLPIYHEDERYDWGRRVPRKFR